MQDYSRYSRQTILKEIGLEGQTKLSSASVLIVGAGGLGCTVAASLAGAGVGELTIIDHDIVAQSNLHRQILYRESDVGSSKADVAKRELGRINSSIKTHSINARLSPANVLELCRTKSLIIDAADNFATSYLLSDTCTQFKVPLLTASVNQTFGYLGLFCKNAPSLRAVFPKLAAQQTNCDTVGVTGPGVGIIASYQAQEAIKTLLGQSSLQGMLLYLNLWDYSQHTIDANSVKETAELPIALISQSQITSSDWVVDVRLDTEIKEAPQAFKVNQNLAGLTLEELAEQALDKRLVLACKSGQRALIKAQDLAQKGVSKLAVVLPD